MRIPQIIMMILFTMSATVNLIKHGEPRGNFNFWASLISIGVETGLLIWGGFF